MAKKAKPSDAEGSAASGTGGGRKKLAVILAAVLLLGGGGGWFFLKKKPADQVAVEVKKPVAFLDVADMMINLAQETPQERPRLLRLKVSLELKDAKGVDEVKPLLPRVQDIFQVFMREVRASDLDGSGSLYRLREELLRRVNLAVFPTRVEAVLFREVIVQ
ncbi:flagellar basal body-associated FliL family protein [Enterovirga rhinocerotis]|uniref:Flagellar protein FliL n=1 Tax=Enterovirga rhinocerotis TaxID=1339210 RepID=A0A4R7BXI3_9HYPH|nr:flagellar basal body-associated FliL family protein [Enterovirga rhinocerotis]TDR88907.1 flagellar FliL protein [Enterovirga rhinocerotis]